VVPYTTFDVADGVLIIAIGNDQQFRAFCIELGVPELGTDPRFALARDRLIHRDAIEAIVADLVRDLPRDALIARLETAGVPVGPVNTLEDVFADPFVEARGTVHTFVREDGVEIPSVAYPGKLSRTPAQFERHPPQVGEHSRELLSEWLDMDDAEFTALAQAGTVKG
jgi:crotonobetainyl-CoA:carnitine CoA-transferase CaiB-like acyl-CoA transferase